MTSQSPAHSSSAASFFL
ncbi:uncharacterized, partial [Tachysurus ichikawai]